LIDREAKTRANNLNVGGVIRTPDRELVEIDHTLREFALFCYCSHDTSRKKKPPPPVNENGSEAAEAAVLVRSAPLPGAI